jgi:predicted TIM-barrel fold metal-dependent hydrolase
MAMDMPQRRLDGRDEVILFPELPIIDAQFHLFIRPVIRYMFDDYLADVSAGHRIVSSVYVETTAFSRPDGPEIERSLGELEFANGMGALGASGVFGPCRIAERIVGHAPISSGDAVGALLDKALALAPERLVGVRQVAIHHHREEAYRGVPYRPAKGLLGSTAFREGFRQLAARSLTFDVAVWDPQLPEVADLAREFPDVGLVLNHMGLPVAVDLDRDDRMEVFRHWRELLRLVAQHPNVTCKISGLGMPVWGFGLESNARSNSSDLLAEAWRPYVETALELFGFERCMAASNYPPDSRSAGFVPLWNALKRCVVSASDDERTALFSGTAGRVYRIAI